MDIITNVPTCMTIGSALATIPVIIISMIVHLEVVYKYSALIMLGAMVTFVIILAIALYFIRLPKTQNAWEPEKICQKNKQSLFGMMCLIEYMS